MLLVALLAILRAAPACAQGRLSERAGVSQTVAGTTIAVEYYRPVARGRGNLFGGVVQWGENCTPGANWATTVEVDHDVRVEGQPLPKGKYGLWIVVRPDTWTVSFHRRARRFHTDRPDSTDEALRLKVRPDSGPHTEVLTFDRSSTIDHPVVHLPCVLVIDILRGDDLSPDLVTQLAQRLRRHRLLL